MKFKDFLAKLKADGKITSQEFIDAMETAPDWEFPDKAVEAFEGSFLTTDRAITHKGVRGKLQGELLDPFNNDFKKILTLIDGIDKYKSSEIDKIDNVYQKSAAITAYLPELVSKLKTATGNADEETKKQLQTAKESVQELMSKLEKSEQEKEKHKKHWEDEYSKKISDFKIDIELEKLANSLTFGKAYSDPVIRKDITKSKLDSVKAQYPLALVEKDGQSLIQVNDKEGKPRFIENSNTPVTISKLLEDTFKPYIKVSNAGDEDEPTPGGQQKFTVKEGNQKIRQGARTTVQ